MKMRHIISRLLFIAALFTVLPALASTQLAPVYPGAVADPIASTQSKTAMVYFARSPLATVRAWYQKRLAKKSAAACSDRDEGCGEFKQQCETVTRTDQMTRCDDFMVLKWNAIPPGGSMVDAYNAGVELEGWKKIAGSQHATDSHSAAAATTGQAASMMAQLNAMSQQLQTASQQEIKQVQEEGKQIGVDAVALSQIPDMPFTGLKQEVLAGRHSQKELDAVYKKYSWLGRAFYPQHKTSNASVPYNHWLVNKTQRRIQAPQTAVGKTAKQLGEGAGAIATRMQQLIAEGHMEEAQQLSEQMAASIQQGQQIGTASTNLQSKDHWKEWMEVIRKLEAHAYKTKIVIN
jgi:hypothetical protein